MFVVLAGIGAYFYFSERGYVVRITEAQIREKLESKLPLTKRYLFIIELTLNHPRISLENGSSRVKAGLDVQLNIKIEKNPKPLSGTIDVSSGVDYRTETGQFFLTNPKIEKLLIQGIPEKYQETVSQAIAIAVMEYFRKHPIYTLRDTNLKQTAIRMTLKNVAIKDRELVLTLGI